jgi:hypothetical protein
MALFTGRSGSREQALANHRAGLAHKDLMNQRRAAAAVLDERTTADSVGIQNPSGAMSSVVQVPQATRQTVPSGAYGPVDDRGDRPGTDRDPQQQTQQQVQQKTQQESRFGGGRSGLQNIGNAAGTVFTALPQQIVKGIGGAINASDDFFRPDSPEQTARQAAVTAAGERIAGAMDGSRLGDTLFGPDAPKPPESNPLVPRLASIIGYLESSSGKFKSSKDSTASGTYHVTDGTATGPQDVPGLAPAKSNSDDDKDEYALRRMDALMRFFNNDPRQVAIAWKQGFTAAKDGHELKPDTVEYLRRFGHQSKGASPGNQDPAAPLPEQTVGVAPGVKVTARAAKKQVEADVGVVEVPVGETKKALTQKSPKPPKTEPNVQLVNAELGIARAKRDELFMVADVYRRAGMGVQYIQALSALNNVTATMVNMAQQKAINLFETNNDPRMLEQMWSKKSGKQIRIVPRSDGKWNVMDGDRMVNEGATTASLTSSARTSASNAHAKAIRAGAVEAHSKAVDAQYKMMEENLKGQWAAFTSERKAQLTAAGKAVAGADGESMWSYQFGRWVQLTPGFGVSPDGEGTTPVVNTSASKLFGGAGSMTSIFGAHAAAIKG